MIADEYWRWRHDCQMGWTVADLADFTDRQVTILAAQCGLPPDIEDQDDIPDIFEMCWADDPETSEFS
jgi:hypothetical protein